MSDILDSLDAGEVLWIGESAPRHDMANGAAAYDPRQDFRLQPTQHQAFDLVFLVERDLAKLKQWPLILDEAMRAVAPGGLIVIRASQSSMMSNFQLANFISRWTNDRFQLVSISDDGSTSILTIRLTHDRRPAAAKGFTFGLVTDGRKPSNVAAFVDSVLAMDAAPGEVEILISGPASALDCLGENAKAVKLVEQPPQFSDKGWITRKKNQLVAAAAQPNIVIAHDRYVLPRTFLEDVGAFGGDFAVLAPRQTTLKGSPLPDWSMVSDELNWSTPGWMEHGDYHPWGFITGGIIIAKTEILRSTPWNELLFWGQAEDVEITRRLSAVGVVQRLARNVQVLSEEPRSGFVEGYERLPWKDDVYSQTERACFNHTQPTGPLGTEVSPAAQLVAPCMFDLMGAGSVEAAANAGLIMSRDWIGSDDSTHWCGPTPPVISFKVAAGLASGVILEFGSEIDAGTLEGVRANSEACRLALISATRVYVALPAAALALSNIVHLTISSGTGRTSLRSFTLASAPPTLPYLIGENIDFAAPLASAYLDAGWHGQEDWGVWAREPASVVSLPVVVKGRKSLDGHALIQAFCPPGMKEQLVRLRVNGHRLGEWRLSPENPAMEIHFRIPARLVTEVLRFEFRASRLISPQQAGVNGDDRALGVGLRSLRLSWAHN